MIVSHKHKFIFIKTKKVAGSSLELALSKFLGEDDVITPLAEEYLRVERGYMTSRNYRKKFHEFDLVDAIDWQLRLLKQFRRRYAYGVKFTLPEIPK